jgi:hypothetical protein
VLGGVAWCEAPVWELESRAGRHHQSAAARHDRCHYYDFTAAFGVAADMADMLLAASRSKLTQKRLRIAPGTDRTSYYMAIPERSLDPNPADGAGLVAHAQALLRFIVGLGWWRHLHPHKNT